MDRTLKITLAYDGSNYVGWQAQARGTSIQSLLEEALAPLNAGTRVKVTGAGRTDAGVHALAQVASCRLRSTLDGPQLAKALNARLPPDLRVRTVADAPQGFHARFSARRKSYAYHVLNAPVADPLVRSWAWHITQRLDLEAMCTALGAVEGTHDFRAFQAAGSRVAHTVRSMERASLSSRRWGGLAVELMSEPGGPGDSTAPDPCDDGAVMLRLGFTADGFLRHMVRNLVGTVIEVGLGRRGSDELARVLAGRDRRRAGPTAPPHGLVLIRVDYGDGQRLKAKG